MRGTAAATPAPSSRRWLAVVAVTGLASAYTLLRGVWPQVFTFATDPAGSLASRLLSAPIHLSDDVMVTLRSGEILLQTGAPAFNRTDLAQAATSYLAPYVYAALSVVLPSNLAVAAFAVAGFGAVVATFALIMASARSLINGAILVTALALTVTNLEFALNGWDHLLQGLLFAVAVVLALGRPPTTGRLIAISLLAAGGSLARPDGVILAAAVLWVAIVRTEVPRKRALTPLLVPFAVAVGGMLALNYLQFGYLTPTTARLKAGAAPSITYILDYFTTSSIGSYTALTLLIILLVVVIAFRRALPLASVLPLSAGSFVTAAVAVVNSDFFPGARMFWVPAVVLAVTLGMTLPGIVRTGPAFPTDDEGRIETRLSPRAEWVVTVAVLVVALGASTALGLKGAVVSKEALGGSRTAQQFLATQWANTALAPDDGSVGVFFAGEAFHVLDFEAADFLGKADEMIATTTPQWGPPGHNKWDIEATLEKWRPQLILPTIDQDPLDPESDAIAADWRANLRTHGYVADLITSPTIRADYSYCRVPDPTGRTEATVDVLLRNDVAERLAGQVTCSG
jgi:hypothetical protein